MMSPEEKAIDAYEDDALSELLMGKGAYYEPEAYMAPSNVPTNWRVVLRGLKSAARRFPDLGQKLERTLTDMAASAEGFYCAIETLFFYMRGRASLLPDLALDDRQIADQLRRSLPLVEPEAKALHLSWMGPTNEMLWERIERITDMLNDDFGIDLRSPPSP